MKKLTALLLCLVLCLSALTGCAKEDASALMGTWYLNQIIMSDLTMNPADMGMEMTIELKEGGVGSANFIGGEPLEATWKLKKNTLTVTANDEPIEFVVAENGTLVNATEEGVSMIMSREAPVASYIEGNPVAAADISEFDGVWTAGMVNMYGVVMPFEQMSGIGLTDGTVTIENGAVTMFGEEEAMNGELIDGQLIVYSGTEGDEENMFGATVSLLDDGTLKVIYLGIIFYCTAAQA